MVFSFELDDAIVFQRFHMDQSPTIRRVRRITFVVAILVAILLFGGTLRLLGDTSIVPWVSCAVGTIGVTILYLLIPKQLRSKLWNLCSDPLVRKMYAEGKNKAALGRKEIELEDDALTIRSPVSETTLLLRAIERIASTDQYTFIYLSSVEAIVVNRSKVIEGDYDGFVAELDRRLEATAN
jgi:hypothetical protein